MRHVIYYINTLVKGSNNYKSVLRFNRYTWVQRKLIVPYIQTLKQIRTLWKEQFFCIQLSPNLIMHIPLLMLGLVYENFSMPFQLLILKQKDSVLEHSCDSMLFNRSAPLDNSSLLQKHITTKLHSSMSRVPNQQNLPLHLTINKERTSL